MFYKIKWFVLYDLIDYITLQKSCDTQVIYIHDVYIYSIYILLELIGVTFLLEYIF